MTKKIFEVLIEEKEHHFDRYDIEMENIAKSGDCYLALQLMQRSKSISSGGPGDWFSVDPDLLVEDPWSSSALLGHFFAVSAGS